MVEMLPLNFEMYFCTAVLPSGLCYNEVLGTSAWTPGTYNMLWSIAMHCHYVLST